MGVCGVGNKGIGREETGKGGVVNAAIHINKAEPIEVLVAGIATVEKKGCGHLGIAPGGWVAAAAPGIEGEGFQFIASTIGNNVKCTLIIGVDIKRTGCNTILYFNNGYNFTTG